MAGGSLMSAGSAGIDRLIGTKASDMAAFYLMVNNVFFGVLSCEMVGNGTKTLTFQICFWCLFRAASKGRGEETLQLVGVVASSL